MNGQSPYFGAYSALFANARTPREQDAIRQRYADAELGAVADDRSIMRQTALNQPDRQFDSRMNILRDLFNRPPPNFYGSGMNQAQSPHDTGVFASSMGSGVPGANRRTPVDGIQPALQNYLLRYLRG